jgi:DNA-binding LytR/AlgR family response regulator
MKTKTPVTNPNDVVFIRERHTLIKINLQDILCINALSNYIVIDMGRKKYTLAIPLGMFMKRLPGNDFVRIHKSHSVRIDKITAIKNNMCFVDKKKFPIARRMRAGLISRLVVI